MSFIPTQYNDPVFVYSLRRLVQNYNDPIVRVIRESDHVEVDVYADSNEEVSYDSIIARTNDTEATVLGEFLNIDGYTDADGLGEVYEGRLSKIYDQSAGSFDVGVNTYSVSFLFVETNLPAYGGSTAIHKVNGVPAFFATATQPMFKLAQARGREVSYHFMTEGVGATQYFGFIDWATSYRIWGLHDIEAEITSATLFPTQQWDINAIYFDSELGDNSFVSNVYSSETFNNFDSVITTVEAQLLDTATTQTAFPDNEVTFRVMSNNWYCDIVAFDGYDPIRRITIEQLYAQSASNTTAFARTSSLLIDNENPNQSGFLAQFPNAAAAYSVRSLTGNTGTDGPKVVRVRRDSDNVEVDVYTDATGFITLDSPIANTTEYTDATVNAPFDTSCTVLGDFVNNSNYNNTDNLDSEDTATVVAWYDQSATDAVSDLPTDAAAAYSVRKLFDTYDGSALKIRRDSDDATQDIGFNGDGDLDVQAIENFVREGVVGADYPSDVPLLDIIPENEQSAPEAAAAYSLRRLREAYDGPLIRVRRDSDHAEADVYAYKLVDGSEQTMDFIGLDSFVSDVDEITDSNPDVPSDEITLRDFARGANLTVVVWYDQAHAYSANWYDTPIGQNNAVQEVSGSQPKIYDEFTGLITENGKPAIDWTNDAMTMPVSVGVDFSIAWVWRSDNAGANQLILNTQVDCYWNPNNVYRLYFGGSIYDFSTGEGAVLPTTHSVVWQNYSTSETWYMRSNGNEKSFAAGPSYTPLSGSIGQSVDGRIQEIIIWNSNESDNREKLEKNINNAYEIYGGWRATVDTWYDQANSNHATQADALSQPTIYDNGGVIMENGKPALEFDGVDDGYTLALGGISVFDNFIVNSSSDQRAMWAYSGSNYAWAAQNGSTGTTFVNYGSPSLYKNGSELTLGTSTDLYNDIRTGNLILLSDLGGSTTSWSDYTIANRSGSSQEWQGYVSEMVFYDTNQSENRPTIEKNINSYYNIYIDNAATQQVAGNQPTLVSSGELVKENGKAAVEFDGTDDLSSGGSLSVKTAFTVTKSDISGRSTIIGGGPSTFLRTEGIVIDLADGFALELSGQTVGSHNLIYGLYDGADSELANRGGTPETGNAGTGFYFDFHIGSKADTNYHEGTMQEIVVYDSNQTENRFDIESNINSAFQIYSAAFPSALDTVPEAKAAYSVRRLTKEYVGPIITVDNGSTEKDFYADFWGNLDKTALTEFANSNTLSITKWWDQSGREEHLVANGVSKPTLDPSTLNISVDDTNKFDDNAIITDINNSYDPDNEIYLLDEYSGAAAAYSLRKLRAGYTGPLVRVRKDGDNNAEVDVYPDSNGTISTSSPVTDVTEITDTNPSVVSNETTFGDFMSGYDGKVVVWYDQSADFTADWYTNPNSQNNAVQNNAVQDVSGSQPKIYDSATGVVTQDGKPALEMLRVSQRNLSATGFAIVGATGDLSAFAVYEESAADSSNSAIFFGPTSHQMRTGGDLYGSYFYNSGSYSGGINSGTTSTDVIQLVSSHADGTDYKIFTNSANEVSSALLGTPDNPTDGVFLGNTNSVNRGLEGHLFEIILYPSDQSSNRTDIERDINRHYQIYDQTNRVVAVHNGDVQRTIDLNQESYTDLKEIIHYQ